MKTKCNSAVWFPSRNFAIEIHVDYWFTNVVSVNKLWSLDRRSHRFPVQGIWSGFPFVFWLLWCSHSRLKICLLRNPLINNCEFHNVIFLEFFQSNYEGDGSWRNGLQRVLKWFIECNILALRRRAQSRWSPWPREWPLTLPMQHSIRAIAIDEANFELHSFLFYFIKSLSFIFFSNRRILFGPLNRYFCWNFIGDFVEKFIYIKIFSINSILN